MLAVAPLFLFPGCDGTESGVALLWLSLSAAVFMLLGPSRREGEMLHQARRRTLVSIAADPMFWAMAAVVAYAATGMCNEGAKLAYDADAGVWSMPPAPMHWLPSSRNGAGFTPFCISVAAMVLAAGCRNALGKSARCAFLTMVSLFSGGAALRALVQARGAAAALFAAAPGATPPASVAFGLAAIASIVALAGAFERRWNALLLLYAFTAGVCAAGTIVFAPPFVAAVFAIAILLVAIVSAPYVWIAGDVSDMFKYWAGVLTATLLCSAMVVFALPADALREKLAAVAGFGFFPEGFAALRARLGEIANQVWRGDMWLGKGIGSFGTEVRLASTPEDWAMWGVATPSSACNGWRELLAERGLVGIAAFAIPPVFVVVSLFVKSVSGIAKRPYYPLLALSVVAAALVYALMLVDCPLSSAAVYPALVAYLTLAPAAFSGRRRN